MNEFEYDVFISYSHADGDWVWDGLLPRLESAGLQVCIDRRSFEPGVPIPDNIESALDNSRHTIVVLTPDFLDNEWTGFELLLSQSSDPAARRRRLIPLLLKPCQVPKRIAMLTYADLVEPAERDEVIGRLIESLRIKGHIFVSYQHVEPDESLARDLCAALDQAGYRAFYDQKLLLGMAWAAEIERQIKICDYMVVLLSEDSVHSEAVIGEVECAHENYAETGKSRLLPVRVAYREPFQGRLKVCLDHINWAFWEGKEDTPRLVEEVLRAMSGGALAIDAGSKSDIVQESSPASMPRPSASAQRVPLELPDGTMHPESTFYVERPGDRLALEAIVRQGVTITIKAPRQMGKSSLLIRTMDAAGKLGKQVAFLDFQLFEKSVLRDADAFYQQFCRLLTYELDLDDRVNEYWQAPLGNPQRCTRYVGRYLLRALKAPLLLAMDEVDSVFGSAFRTDFFSMLRSWHNRRTDPRWKQWKQLDLALVTSTEPYQLIEDLNQSPFNVGQVVELADFTSEQVADLNRRHGSPLTPDQESCLMALLGGHPYLTRRALYLVASEHISFQDLLNRASEDRGPFGDHLRYHLMRLHGHEKLIQGLRTVLRDQACPDDRVFHRLRGAGLVREEKKARVPRCGLYAQFFRERLDV